MATFLPKYEQMAQAAGFLGLQIVHFPADAQLSVTRSLRASARVRGVSAAHALTALPSARVLAERLGGNLSDRVGELLGGDVAEAAIRDFLLLLVPGNAPGTTASEARGYRRARALRVADGTTLTLPTGVVLEGWQAQLFVNVVLHAMTTTMPAAPSLLRALQDMADALDVTVGLGVAATGTAGDGAGRGLGAGVLIAPGRRIGFYGSLEHSVAGFALGGAITLQLTVVKGGPSSFSGRRLSVGGTIGQGLLGGTRTLLSASGPDQGVVGFIAELGVGAGLSPAELTTSIHDTASSLGVPGVVVALGASEPVVAHAGRFGEETVASVQRLLAEGVPSEDIRRFLDQLSPESAPSTLGFVVPLGDGEAETEERFELHLPGSTVLSGWRAELFLGVLAGWISLPSLGGGFIPIYLLMQGLRALCNRTGVTIAIGPAISGGVAAGGSLGAGLIFAPDDRVGFYGSGALLNGALASIEATVQVTVLQGGPELMDGFAVALGGSVSAPSGVSPVGGFYVLFNGERFIGVMAEIGASAGLSPFEAMAGFQYSGQSVEAQGLSQAASLAGLWARSSSGRRALAHGQSWSAQPARALSLPDLSAWQHLIRFKPSPTIARALYDKMGSILPGPMLWEGWPVQPLDRAAGAINLTTTRCGSRRFRRGRASRSYSRTCA